MTFIVGWATDDMALLASDFRAMSSVNGGVLPMNCPKLAGLANGWLAFSGVAVPGIMVARRLRGLIASPDVVNATTAQLVPVFAEWSQELTADERAYFYSQAGLTIWATMATPDLELWQFDPMLATSHQLPPFKVMCMVPTGADRERIGGFLAAYRDDLFGARRPSLPELERILETTHRLFENVAGHLGPNGTVSAAAEVGVIARHANGELIQRHSVKGGSGVLAR